MIECFDYRNRIFDYSNQICFDYNNRIFVYNNRILCIGLILRYISDTEIHFSIDDYFLFSFQVCTIHCYLIKHLERYGKWSWHQKVKLNIFKKRDEMFLVIFL